MIVKEAKTVNNRCYLEVFMGGTAELHEEYFRDLDTEDEKNIPGYIYPGGFITSVRIIDEKHIPPADNGPIWKIVRTGMDNIANGSIAEENTGIPLRGYHFTDLKYNEQKAIRSFCKHQGIEIDFDFNKMYPFEPKH